MSALNDPSNRPVQGPGKSVDELASNPADWAGTDRYDKEALKHFLSIKRKNDSIRKREFDMLRALRQKGEREHFDPTSTALTADDSGGSRINERQLAGTLKKIDAIEAQMSMQWRKTHSPDLTAMAPQATLPLPLVPAAQATAVHSRNRASDYLDTIPAPPADLVDAVPAGAHALPPSLGQASAPSARPPQPRPPTPAPTPRTIRTGRLPHFQDTTTSEFSDSKMLAFDVREPLHDADLQEAAIRYANGDVQGAQACLLEALAALGGQRMREPIWLALLDLYRATDQQEPFEDAAIDYASRFDRSAPQWFSMQDIFNAPNAPSQQSAPASTWKAPATLGIQSVAMLKAALERAQPPWRLDWTKLQSIEALAAPALHKLFLSWDAPQVQLRFIQSEQLKKVLQAATPSSNPAVAQDYWALRLEALRIMNRPDEFELVALDYCVTYEMSPPTWMPTRCDYQSVTPDGSYLSGQTIIGGTQYESIPSGLSSYGDSHASSSNMQAPAQLARVNLSGHLEGDATEALQSLNDALAQADAMVISCTKLIRVDFTAAGALLNWVMDCRARGRQLRFEQLNHLVAAFFDAMGISEHATVVTRDD